MIISRTVYTQLFYAKASYETPCKYQMQRVALSADSGNTNDRHTGSKTLADSVLGRRLTENQVLSAMALSNDSMSEDGMRMISGSSMRSVIDAQNAAKSYWMKHMSNSWKSSPRRTSKEYLIARLRHRFQANDERCFRVRSSVMKRVKITF